MIQGFSRFVFLGLIPVTLCAGILYLLVSDIIHCIQVWYSLIQNMHVAWALHVTFFMCVHTRLMTSELSFRALVYTLDVCMIVCTRMHACQERTCQIWIVSLCIWHACEFYAKDCRINKLCEHIHVLRCGSSCATRCRAQNNGPSQIIFRLILAYDQPNPIW